MKRYTIWMGDEVWTTYDHHHRNRESDFRCANDHCQGLSVEGHDENGEFVADSIERIAWASGNTTLHCPVCDEEGVPL